MKKIYKLLYLNDEHQVCEELFTAEDEADKRREYLEEIHGFLVLKAPEEVSEKGDNTKYVIGLSKDDIAEHLNKPVEELEDFFEKLEKSYSYSDMFEGLDDYYDLFKEGDLR